MTPLTETEALEQKHIDELVKSRERFLALGNHMVAWRVYGAIKRNEGVKHGRV